jgi:oligosaccharide translocation protein RFT1
MIKQYQLFYVQFCVILIVLYQYYHYSICVSNKKIHVSKIKHDPNALENEEVRVISESA